MNENDDLTKPDMRDFDLLKLIDANSKALSNQTNAPDIRYIAGIAMKEDILIMLSRILTSLDCSDVQDETVFNQVNDLFAAINHSSEVARKLNVGYSDYGYERSQEP